MGEAQFNAGNFVEAKASFEKAAELYSKQKKEKELAAVNTWIAKCTVKCAENLDLDNAKPTGNKDLIQQLTRNKGYIDNAADSVSNYVQMGRALSTVKDTQQLRVTLQQVGNMLCANPATYNTVDRATMWQFSNTSASISGLNNYNLAVGQKMVYEAQKTNNFTTEITGKLLIAKGLIAENKTGTAEQHLKETVALCEKSKDFDGARKSMQLLVELYQKEKNIVKALEAYNRLIQYSDSLLVYSLKNKVNEIAQKELMAGQLEKISLLETAQNEKEIRLNKQRNTIWILGGVMLCLAGLAYALWRNIQQKQIANYRIRLQGLRTQMNPHFIFNSLNSVNNFISQNDEKSANKYIADFSKLMRSVMSNSGEDFIPLHEELSMLKIYLDLENARFKDKFTHELVIDPALKIEEIWVPPMLVQPYLENAVWHGLRYKDAMGKLSVVFKSEHQQLICIIEDNGIGRKQSLELKTKHQKMNTSTGMKNTAERIHILNKLYKIGLKISIVDLEENQVAKGTRVIIAIPFKIKELNHNDES